MSKSGGYPARTRKEAKGDEKAQFAEKEGTGLCDIRSEKLWEY